MPPLRTAQGVAYTIYEKMVALRERFYPTFEADLGDITDTSFVGHSFKRGK